MTTYTANVQAQVLEAIEALSHNQRATCNMVEARILSRAILQLQNALVTLDKAEHQLQEAVVLANRAREVA